MSEDFDKWYENKLLEMAVKHKAIEDLLVDYKWSVVVGAPREHQRLFRELFSKLVKTVGH